MLFADPLGHIEAGQVFKLNLFKPAGYLSTVLETIQYRIPTLALRRATVKILGRTLETKNKQAGMIEANPSAELGFIVPPPINFR